MLFPYYLLLEDTQELNPVVIEKKDRKEKTLQVWDQIDFLQSFICAKSLGESQSTNAYL